MTEQDMEQHYKLADSLRDEIHARLQVQEGEEIECPHAKSNMTPCVVRDGGVVVVYNGNSEPICVGCEKRLADIAEKIRPGGKTYEDTICGSEAGD